MHPATLEDLFITYIFAVLTAEQSLLINLDICFKKVYAVNDKMSVQDKPKRSSFKILGMEFAPVIIPLERRIQTLAVLFWIATFLFLGTLTMTIMTMLMFTQWKWIPILYVTWLVYDWNTPYTGGRKNT